MPRPDMSMIFTSPISSDSEISFILISVILMSS